MESQKQLENIVIRCKSGQREAFEQLFELYQPRLKYYVRRLNSNSETDDILQDIWIKVFRKIRKLKENSSFPIWLYRIARNEVFLRFRQNEKFVELPEETEHPECKEDNYEFSAEDAQKLHNALNKIQPYHREVLTLSFIEQMTYEQIAEVIGCNIGTVRSRIFYAKQSLRKEMERNHG
ncbi:MAG: sigma-70 family RNA polymerase sigma factor [Sedimentisphaerales bacterium]|nr:sigma-70 family RNA polymerase sigma factor [Sedimentisphaerales bacterium]